MLKNFFSILLIIIPRGFQYESNRYVIMGWKSYEVFRFVFEPLVQGQTRIDKLKSAYNLLITTPRVLICENNLWEIMDWDSSDVVRFNPRPLLQGQTRIAKLKGAENLLLILDVCNMKPTYS